MYQVQSTYANYYKDFINRDIRQFKLECVIKSNINIQNVPESEIASLSIDYDLLSGAEEYCIGNLVAGKLTMKISSKIPVYETNTITLTIRLRAEDSRGLEIWIPIPLGRFHVFNVSSTTLSKTIVAYDDLGTEAIRKLEVENFPVVVVIDKDGNNLYETAIKQYCKE